MALGMHVAILACALVAVPCAARTLYVNNGSPHASDSGPGTESMPFMTLKPATLQANPGDAVVVSTGVYRERVSPARGGTKGLPITYTAAANAKVVIRASETLRWKQQDDATYTAMMPVNALLHTGPS